MPLAPFCVNMHQSESFLDPTDRITFETSVVNDLPATTEPRRRWEWTRSGFYCPGSCLSCAWVSLCLDTKTGFSDFSACPQGSRVALTFQNPPHRPGGYFARMFIKVWFCMAWVGRNTMAEKTTKGRRSHTWRRNAWKGLSPNGVIIRENVSRHRTPPAEGKAWISHAAFTDEQVSGTLGFVKLPPLKVTSEQNCHRASVQKTIHYQTSATGIH